MMDTIPATDIPAADDALVIQIREGLRDHVALHHRRELVAVSSPQLLTQRWGRPIPLLLNHTPYGVACAEGCPFTQTQDETTYQCRNMERCARRAALL